MSQDKKKKDPIFGETIPDHPAAVLVNFSRCNGRIDLFGSSIPSDNFIRLTVSRAETKHDLGRDTHFAREQLIEVNLSPIQFAELLTTMNHGTGITGTMSYYNRERVEPYRQAEKPVQRTERYGMETLNEMIEKNEKAMKDLSEKIAASTKLTKKEKEAIQSDITVINHLRSNYKFFIDQYAKAVGKVKTEAKAEIDAFITHTISSLGQEALNQKLALMQNVIEVPQIEKKDEK